MDASWSGLDAGDPVTEEEEKELLEAWQRLVEAAEEPRVELLEEARRCVDVRLGLERSTGAGHGVSRLLESPAREGRFSFPVGVKML